MSTTTLITILIILLVILIPLLLSYLVYPDEKIKKKITQKSPKQKPVLNKDKPLSFEEISAIFSNQESSKEDFRQAIEMLIKHHGKIHAKLGDLPHPDYKRYNALIIKLCKNPSSDKDVIILLDQKLRARNPKYSLNIDEAINKGLAGRGF